MPTRDYYLILGVRREDPAEAIREAYKELALQYHPDRAGERSTPLFQDIVEAYRVLSDPERRASYDAGLRHAQREARPARVTVTPSAPRAVRVEPLVPEPVSRVRDFLAFGPSLDDLLEHLFEPLSRPEPRPVEVDLLLSPGQAAQGGLATFGVPVPVPCKACRGAGRTRAGRCGRCQGRGLVEEERPFRLAVPPRVPDGAIFEAPLRGLGLHGLFLRVLVRVRG
ncbi:MAG TPA: DnaJ domain-containing protein [Myxococcales bacterium]